ncbi:MAG: zinc ribbon domain-containing protein [Gemmatimonadota bacterium]|nr:zinc ribbon domain-containing protein [Gemmatimonadota bacterium]
MPTYEYHCRACQADFSRLEKIAEHDASETACPKCGSREVDRVIGGFYARTPRKS